MPKPWAAAAWICTNKKRSYFFKNQHSKAVRSPLDILLKFSRMSFFAQFQGQKAVNSTGAGFSQAGSEASNQHNDMARKFTQKEINAALIICDKSHREFSALNLYLQQSILFEDNPCQNFRFPQLR